MKRLFLLVILAFGVIFAACGREETPIAQIHLYGERHGSSAHLDKQFELWYNYYHNHNMRHLFLESPFFTAEFLNIWMSEDDDEILNAVFRDLRGTAMDNRYTRAFLRRIKAELPETIFHGTDIGHQYRTTGPRFSQHLRDNGLESGEAYLLTLENIEQGRLFYNELEQNHSLRANMMVENFVRTFDSLDGESIMSAFYGNAHVELGYYHPFFGGGPTMAAQLREIYGEIVHTTDLRALIASAIPDTLTIEGREYAAAFYGEETRVGNIVAVAFWRLENAFDDFKNHPAASEDGVMWHFDHFPIPGEANQIYVLRETMWDGNIVTRFFRT
ncbi:MAG: hypothetical protein LBE35_08765, partial [Clostridiales bacterium]|nr:hypothetical protein [Clostridiales bacterium]